MNSILFWHANEMFGLYLRWIKDKANISVYPFRRKVNSEGKHECCKDSKPVYYWLICYSLKGLKYTHPNYFKKIFKERWNVSRLAFPFNLSIVLNLFSYPYTTCTFYCITNLLFYLSKYKVNFETPNFVRNWI